MADVTDILPQNTEDVIDQIHHILLKEGQTTELAVSDDKLLSKSAATLSDGGVDEEVEDENDNNLTNLTRAETFYADAQNYWKSVPATVDGMLGGLSNVHITDIRSSHDFLRDIFKMKPAPGKNLALDCGAGIGRVTKHLLLPIFNNVDLVEQDKHFADSIKEYVGNSPKLGKIYNRGLQEFQPNHKTYDVIWSQWVLGHLTNDNFIEFFQRCAAGLNKNGIVVIKENVTSSGKVDFDEIDSSVTRPLSTVKELIAASGFRIIKMVRQNNWPAGIYPVYMFAMKPIKNVVKNDL